MGRKYFSPFVAGLLFGVGLILSGMTQPPKVIAFLDFFGGAWDPSLAFVMGGALLVFGPLQARVRAQRETPLFAQIFQIPERRDIDPKLVTGAALFGIGWGLGGYCPGPGLTALASGGKAVTFVAAMATGMLVHWVLLGRPAQRASRRKASAALREAQAGSR